MKTEQKQVSDWIKKLKIGYFQPMEMLACLTEEIGEVAREVNHQFGPKKKKSTENMANLGDELADVIFSVICMANAFDIDLDKHFKKVIDKCYGRDKDRWGKK